MSLLKQALGCWERYRRCVCRGKTSESRFSVKVISTCNTTGQLCFQSSRFNQPKDKQKRCESHPLVCTTALVPANTDKQSSAVLRYSQPRRLKAELCPPDNMQGKVYGKVQHKQPSPAACLAALTCNQAVCKPRLATDASEAERSASWRGRTGGHVYASRWDATLCTHHLFHLEPSDTITHTHTQRESHDRKAGESEASCCHMSAGVTVKS